MPKRRGGSKSAYRIQRGTNVQRMAGQPRYNVTSYNQLVNKVEQLTKEVAIPERKVLDTNATTASVFITTAGPPQDFSTCFGSVVNLIPVGNTANTRIGEKISMINLTWKFTVAVDEQIAADDVFSYRVIICMQRIQTALTLQTLLAQYFSQYLTDTPSQTQNDMLSRALSGNMIILKDKTYCLDEFGIGLIRHHKVFKKLDIDCEFKSAGGAITDIETFPLWCIIVPNVTVNAVFFVSSFTRLNYTDL